MSTSPTHEELQEMLPAAALGTADPAGLQMVHAHVQQCEACASLLEDYRDVVAGLALQLPERAMTPGRRPSVRSRLLARLRSSSGESPAAPLHTGARGTWRGAGPLMSRWAGWAVAASLAGVLLMHHAVHRPLNYGWLVAGALGLLALVLGIYASWQGGRVAKLTEDLTRLERGVARRDLRTSPGASRPEPPS